MVALLLVAFVLEGPITMFGMGPVRVGMTPAEAALVLGENLAEVDPDHRDEACRYVRIASRPTLRFMIEEGRIVRVETTDRTWVAGLGIRVGDSPTHVRRLYRGHLDIARHHYDPKGQYLIVRSRDRRHALVFETDGDRVVEIRGGLLPAAEYVEGCL